jgi:hypothetical protein
MTYQRRQNTPNTAVESATRRSHQHANSSPPATANPSTAAITGFDNNIRVGPIGASLAADYGRVHHHTSSQRDRDEQFYLIPAMLGDQPLIVRPPTMLYPIVGSIDCWTFLVVR